MEYDSTETSIAAASKEDLLIEDAMSIEFKPDFADFDIDMSSSIKIPLDELLSLGTALSSLPPQLRTATQTVELAAKGLYQVTDAAGNPLDASQLHHFKNGEDCLASFSDANGKMHQAHLKPVDSLKATVNTTMPYDPTSLFMAAALSEINKKLDVIQETQQMMFSYLKNKDKGKLQANLEQLSEVMKNYRFQRNHDEWMRSQRNLITIIRKESKEAIRHHQLMIRDLLKPAGIIHVDQEVIDKSTHIKSEFEDYRVSTYLYAFSTFLDIMLHKNFERPYLHELSQGIEKEANDYRHLYAKAYYRIDADAGTSAEAGVLGGLSGICGFIGKAVEQTPVGEALDSASRQLTALNDSRQTGLTDKLIEVSRSDVRPFIESIDNISHLYNDPVLLTADREAVYVLPANGVSAKTSA